MPKLLSLILFAHTYPVDGIVVAVDPQARTMLVSHRPIAHYMPAMMMPFRVADTADLAALHPGARIRFDLAVSKSVSVARNIRKTGDPDTAIAPPPEKLPIGAPLPAFQLTGQDGRVLRSADLLGKPVAIDFIYTRCPLPDVCPRLSANFAILQRRFGDRVTLLSITVDPDFDTPAVLAGYARRWSAGASWHFLTGNVAPVAGALGELYWADEGSIGHNSITSIFDRNGRLAAAIDGANYRADQLVNLISRQLESHP
ncbi:MAG: electron transport protein SCO1/SenC [Candidatus Solibacter sp.]|jgi:protein SCO1/2|nr:electron transport protein SCO1/SenC [Candidatus Solibacter sp.]